MESNYQQHFTALTAIKQPEETETDQAMRMLLTEQREKMCNEFHFMLEQLHLKLRQDFKITQRISQKE